MAEQDKSSSNADPGTDKPRVISAARQQPEVRRALQQTVVDAAGPLAGGLSLLFVVFIIFNLLDLPAHAVVPVVTSDAVLVVVFGLLWWAFQRHHIPPRWVNAVTSIMACLVLSNVMLTFALLSEPFYTNYVLIIIIGAGTVLLSLRWVTFTLIIIFSVWAPIAWQATDSKQFAHLAFTIFGATMLSLVLHTARLRTHVRLERMRQGDLYKQKEALQQALSVSQRDLSERKLAEERLRHIVQGVRAIVWESDVDTGRFSFVSDFAEQLLGYPVDRWKDEPGFWFQRVHPEDRARCERFFEACGEERAGEQECECRALTRGGDEVWLRLIVRAVPGPERRVQQLRGVMVDVTLQKAMAKEKEELKEQLDHARRLEAIGTLAGGVAHDMNNILAGISGVADVMAHDLEADSEVRKDLEDIMSSCKRGKELAQNLLGFARRGKYQKNVLALDALLQGTLSLLERTLPKAVCMRTEVDGTSLNVEGDQGQLNNVLLNLAVNASDAMEGNGRLTFALDRIQLGPHRPDYPEARQLPDGRYVRLVISDTGCGIEADLLEHVFEPFFTTKPAGKGTGLGLAMAYGTISSHCGCIAVESTPGEGTDITLLLPAVEGAATSSEASAGERRPARREASGTVLLVDDEPLLRSSGRRMLRRLGYDVLLAENGQAALEVFEQHGDDALLIVLDLNMPVLDGAETYKRLKDIDPQVRVVIASGNFKEEVTSELLANDAVGFLQKPYTISDLSEALEQLNPRRG